MKILIDERLPRKLKRELTGHEVYTVPEMGWASQKNGALLALMVGRFDVFLTIDSNLKYQQELADVEIAFVVLKARNNRLATLLPLMQALRNQLDAIQPGQIIEIEPPA